MFCESSGPCGVSGALEWVGVEVFVDGLLLLCTLWNPLFRSCISFFMYMCTLYICMYILILPKYNSLCIVHILVSVSGFSFRTLYFYTFHSSVPFPRKISCRKQFRRLPCSIHSSPFLTSCILFLPLTLSLSSLLPVSSSFH